MAHHWRDLPWRQKGLWLSALTASAPHFAVYTRNVAKLPGMGLRTAGKLQEPAVIQAALMRLPPRHRLALQVLPRAPSTEAPWPMAQSKPGLRGDAQSLAEGVVRTRRPGSTQFWTRTLERVAG